MLRIHSKTVEQIGIKITYELQDALELHDHSFLELAYIADGEAIHITPENSVHVKKGDYFIIDHNTAHGYQLIDNKPFKILNCLFLPRIIDDTLHNCRNFEEMVTSQYINIKYNNLTARPTKYLYLDEDDSIYELLMKMLSEFNTKDIAYPEVMKSILIEILIKTLRKIKIPNAAILDNSMVQHVIKYVQKHYYEKLSLESIAADYHYSLSYASRIFKSETGMTFQEFVQSIRIRECCRLLLNSNKKVSEIAQSVGYHDIKHFHAAFKKYTGVTPLQYRKTHHAVID